VGTTLHRVTKIVGASVEVITDHFRIFADIYAAPHVVTSCDRALVGLTDDRSKLTSTSRDIANIGGTRTTIVTDSEIVDTLSVHANGRVAKVRRWAGERYDFASSVRKTSGVEAGVRRRAVACVQ